MAQLDDETVTIRKGNSSATVHTFGATLISWKPNGKEAIFVSKQSKFDNETPIRGGVPVVFPHFGPWEIGPQHGFARKMKWSVKENSDPNASTSATFILQESDSSLAIWNYTFRIEYTVSLISESEVKMEAVITNTDSKSFDFTFLLHTYFLLPDVRKSSIIGLDGCMYIDKVSTGLLCDEEEKEVVLTEHTDRIYQDTPSVLALQNASEGREIKIKTHNLPDTVVWNPWTEGAKKMADFGDDEWENMICIEPGYVSAPYTLKPGETTFSAFQILSIINQ